MLFIGRSAGGSLPKIRVCYRSLKAYYTVRQTETKRGELCMRSCAPYATESPSCLPTTTDLQAVSAPATPFPCLYTCRVPRLLTDVYRPGRRGHEVEPIRMAGSEDISVDSGRGLL